MDNLFFVLMIAIPAFLVLVVVAHWLAKTKPRATAAARAANPVAQLDRSPTNAVLKTKSDTEKWWAAARIALAKDGIEPDSICCCWMDFNGNDKSVEVRDFCIGSFREKQLLRFAARTMDDADNVHAKPTYDPVTDVYTWDVPYAEFYAVICRDREFPHLDGTPDGRRTYTNKYQQTRVYRIGHGLQLRLLDETYPDYWLHKELASAGVRFSRDDEEDPTYGEDPCQLDRYLRRVRSKAEADDNDKLTAYILYGDTYEKTFQEYRAKCPQHIRDYVRSKQYWRDIQPILHFADADGTELAQGYTEYANNLFDLTLVGAIRKIYYPVLYYRFFPDIKFASAIITKDVKADYLKVIQKVLARFPEFR